MKKITAVLFLLVTSLSSMQSKAQSSATAEPLLQGKVYTIRIKQQATTKKGTEFGKEEADEFSFKGGKFKTVGFARNFEMPVKPYEITNVDTATGTQIISWECPIAWSPDDNVLFKGTIEGGNSIKGTVDWTVKNKPKKSLHYEFEGELKEKKKKPAPAAPASK